jgi:hypothetical protein
MEREDRVPRAARSATGGGIALMVATLAALAAAELRAEPARILNGFRLQPSAIPEREILRGGPPRDGIPALEDPQVVSAEEAAWGVDQVVIGVAAGGEARAYPLALLTWHELVNDRLGGRPILVSYCPLCGTALVFDRRVDGQVRRFGVSGLLYRSDLLMFDRETESLWSQISGRAETGPSMGVRLRLQRSRMMRWEQWKQLHPETTILSQETGYSRDYGRSPYGDYASSKRIFFPVPRDARFHPKTPTLGLRIADGVARAYPAPEVRRAGGRVEESFQGHRVVIRLEGEAQHFAVEAPEPIEVIEGFWFAWAAFHPETSVFNADLDDTQPSGEGR